MFVAILNAADALEHHVRHLSTEASRIPFAAEWMQKIGSCFSSLMPSEEREEIYAPPLSATTGIPAQSARIDFGELFIK